MAQERTCKACGRPFKRTKGLGMCDKCVDRALETIFPDTDK